MKMNPLIAALIVGSISCAAAVEPAEVPTSRAESTWHTDYAEAMRVARAERKMLFIYFCRSPDDRATERFHQNVLGDSHVQAGLQKFVTVRVPVDAKISVGGKQISLIRHGAFREMLGRPGIAIVDFENPTDAQFGGVVSTFPFNPGNYYRASALRVILDLPKGTLTQRTMIFAVRTHPEAPQSTLGRFHPALAKEAQKHSVHQARITLQGHHAWDSRFHQINARLGDGSLATEVVAESWPGENLVEAAVECVHSWRQSPGHWSAVRGRHGSFGYDIKRGSNGIWYATGIFGGRGVRGGR